MRWQRYQSRSGQTIDWPRYRDVDLGVVVPSSAHEHMTRIAAGGPSVTRLVQWTLASGVRTRRALWLILVVGLVLTVLAAVVVVPVVLALGISHGLDLLGGAGLVIGTTGRRVHQHLRNQAGRQSRRQ